MGDRSAIEWTDASWNPVTGCSKVSPGCAHCYAETLALGRLAGKAGYPGKPWTPENAAENVSLRPERLDQPLRWTRKRMIFVNSMSDLFHELIPDDFIARVFAVMGAAGLMHDHVFQVLTKRPERMRELVGSREFETLVYREVEDFEPPKNRRHAYHRAVHRGIFHGLEWPIPNVWLGTSIENRRFVGRADELRQTPAAVRFISAEPLLGPLVEPPRFDIDGDLWGPGPTELSLEGIDWLIVGGESGPGHRPMRPQWVRDLRTLAEHYGTAFFFKQWGGRTPKAGGRELDGRTYDAFPVTRTEVPV